MLKFPSFASPSSYLFALSLLISSLLTETESCVGTAPAFQLSYQGSKSRSSMSTRKTHVRSLSNIQENQELLDQILDVAIAASKKAGAIILGNAGGSEVTERKANSRDLLTLIDPLCEKVRAC